MILRHIFYCFAAFCLVNNQVFGASNSGDSKTSSKLIGTNDGHDDREESSGEKQTTKNLIGGNDGHDSHDDAAGSTSKKSEAVVVADICQVCSCSPADDNAATIIIDCSWRQLTSESINGLQVPPNCVAINLAGNDFSDSSLPDDLFQPAAENLNEINLSMNKLDWLPSSIFNNLLSLQILDLSYNQMTDFESGTFGDLSLLEQLNLDFNRLTALNGRYFFPVGGYSLRVLAAQQNVIASLDPDLLTTCGKLETLRLSANRISNVDVNLLDPASGSLTTLDLSNNYISYLPQHLFQGMESLVEIDLSNNGLKHLSSPSVLQPLASTLKKLNLSANELEELDKDTFSGFSVIESVSLDDNRLTAIEKNLWGLVTPTVGDETALNTLQSLGLANNEFRHIDEAVTASMMPLFQKNNDATVRLDGNPWQCDSRMAYVKQYGVTAAALLQKISSGMVCDGPNKAAGSTLANWRPSVWDEAINASINATGEVKIENYRELFGNCPGNVIGNSTVGQLSACSARCRSTSDCVGFTFAINEGTCLLKSKTCGIPYASESNRFFESTKIARLEARLTTTPETDFTRPTRTKPTRATRTTTEAPTTVEESSGETQRVVLTRATRTKPTKPTTPTTTVTQTQKGGASTASTTAETWKTLVREWTTPATRVRPVVAIDGFTTGTTRRATEASTTPTPTTVTSNRTEATQTSTTTANPRGSSTTVTTSTSTATRPTSTSTTTTTSRRIEATQTSTTTTTRGSSTTATTSTSTTTARVTTGSTTTQRPASATTTQTSTTTRPTSTTSTTTQRPTSTTTTTTTGRPTSTTTETITRRTIPTRPPARTVPTVPTTTLPLRIGGPGSTAAAPVIFGQPATTTRNPFVFVPAGMAGAPGMTPAVPPSGATPPRTTGAGQRPNDLNSNNNGNQKETERPRPSDGSGEVFTTRGQQGLTTSTPRRDTPPVRQPGQPQETERTGPPVTTEESRIGVVPLFTIRNFGGPIGLGGPQTTPRPVFVPGQSRQTPAGGAVTPANVVTAATASPALGGFGQGNNAGAMMTMFPIILTAAPNNQGQRPPDGSEDGQSGSMLAALLGILRGNSSSPSNPSGVYRPPPRLEIPTTTTTTRRTTTTQTFPTPTTSCWWCLPSTSTRPTTRGRPGAPTTTMFNPANIVTQPPMPTPYHWEPITTPSTTTTTLDPDSEDGQRAFFLSYAARLVTQRGNGIGPAFGGMMAPPRMPGGPMDMMKIGAETTPYNPPTPPKQIITDKYGNWIDARLAALWLTTEAATTTTTTTTTRPFVQSGIENFGSALPVFMEPPKIDNGGDYVDVDTTTSFNFFNGSSTTTVAFDPNNRNQTTAATSRATRRTTTINAVLQEAISRAKAMLELGSASTMAMPVRTKTCSAPPMFISFNARRTAFTTMTAYYTCDRSPSFGGTAQLVEQRPVDKLRIPVRSVVPSVQDNFPKEEEEYRRQLAAQSNNKTAAEGVKRARRQANYNMAMPSSYNSGQNPGMPSMLGQPAVYSSNSYFGSNQPTMNFGSSMPSNPSSGSNGIPSNPLSGSNGMPSYPSSGSNGMPSYPSSVPGMVGTNYGQPGMNQPVQNYGAGQPNFMPQNLNSVPGSYQPGPNDMPGNPMSSYMAPNGMNSFMSQPMTNSGPQYMSSNNGQVVMPDTGFGGNIPPGMSMTAINNQVRVLGNQSAPIVPPQSAANQPPLPSWANGQAQPAASVAVGAGTNLIQSQPATGNKASGSNTNQNSYQPTSFFAAGVGNQNMFQGPPPNGENVQLYNTSYNNPLMGPNNPASTTPSRPSEWQWVGPNSQMLMTCDPNGEWVGNVDCMPNPDQLEGVSGRGSSVVPLDVFAICIDPSSPSTPSYYKTQTDSSGNVMFKLPPYQAVSCYISYVALVKGATVTVKVSDIALQNDNNCNTASITVYGLNEASFYAANRGNVRFNKIKQICNNNQAAPISTDPSYFGWVEFVTNSYSASGATVVFIPNLPTTTTVPTTRRQ